MVKVDQEFYTKGVSILNDELRIIASVNLFNGVTNIGTEK